MGLLGFSLVFVAFAVTASLSNADASADNSSSGAPATVDGGNAKSRLSLAGVADPPECTFPSQRVQCGALTCNKTTRQCDRCVDDDDCYEGAMDCDDGLCLLRPLLGLRAGPVLAAMGFAGFICAVAAIAGVGGGGLLVPLFAFAMQLPMEDAVALSQATILGQSATSFLIALRRFHPQHAPPQPTRPVINYQYLALILPNSLLGTLGGAVAGRVFPDWLRVIFLMALLGVLSVRVVARARRQFQRDLRSDEATMADAEAPSEGRGGIVLRPAAAAATTTAPATTSAAATVAVSDSASASRSSPSLAPGATAVSPPSLGRTSSDGGEDDSPPQDAAPSSPPAKVPELLPQFPRLEIGLCAAGAVVLFAANAARARVTCGSLAFALWYLVPTVLLFGTFLAYRRFLAQLWARVRTGSLAPEAIPFKWGTKTTVVFPIASAIAGGAASLLGIGGGLVLSVLLFETGLTPEEVSATGTVATFLVSAESALQCAFQRQIRGDFFVAFAAVGVVGGLVGQLVLTPEIRRRGWRFLIFVALGFIMAGSMLLLSAVGIYKTVEAKMHGGSLWFGYICKQL